METPQNTAQHNTLMGILAYLGPLVIVSFFIAKDDPFVKFHIKQGLVLFVVEVAMWFLGSIFPPLWIILWLVNLVVLVFVIIGIMNVFHGQEKELPIIGKYSSHFPI